MTELSGTPLSSGPSVLVPYARLHLPLAAKTTKISHISPCVHCDTGVKPLSEISPDTPIWLINNAYEKA